MFDSWFFWLIMGLLFAGVLFVSFRANAVEVKAEMKEQTALGQLRYPKNLWQGLVAEETQPVDYWDYYAMACCYRNKLARGQALGCVGLKRKDLKKFVADNVKFVFDIKRIRLDTMAQQAVEDVFEKGGKDITMGATQYENIEAYGLPWWANGMVQTVKIGRHTYFAE